MLRISFLAGCIAVALLPTGNAAAQVAGDAPSVTPYRPTVSNPAALPEPGWIEMELGTSRVKPGDGSRQTSLPFQLKYAFDEDFGVLLGGDARVSAVDADGARIKGRGDTTLLFKHRWQIPGSDTAALGLEWGAKSPTARDGLGTGKSDYIVNGIYSRQLGDNTLDLNLNATHLGRVDEGAGTQWGWAASVSRNLDPRWSVAGELSGSGRRGTTGQGQALFALGYALSERVVLDAGFAVGVTRATADRGAFFGISFLLAKLR